MRPARFERAASACVPAHHRLAEAGDSLLVDSAESRAGQAGLHARGVRCRSPDRRGAAGEPQGGGWENGSSDAASVSNDGNLVVFQSAASNLVPGDQNGLRDVFLRDMASGTTTLVSHGAAGDAANGASSAGLPGITPNGTRVVISSTASNLVAGDTNQAGDVLVYDRGSDTFVLASVGADDAPAKGTSSDPSLSDDGRWVAFASFAPNLVPGDCTTAGPIGPNRIDRRAPSITISTPADGAVVPLDATVRAVYSCDDGGSGTASCDSPTGRLDTTNVGYNELRITTADAVGDRASFAVGIP